MTNFRARLAGGLYLFSLVTAIAGELLLSGVAGIAAGLTAVAGMVAMTLLLCSVFKPVNRSLSWLAAAIGLVGLVFEALRWNPRGVDVALVFHGCFALLIATLIVRSSFLPGLLAAPIAISGLSWLTYISPPLAQRLSPYNQGVGLLGELLMFLWLLVVGVNDQGSSGGAPGR